MVDFRHIVGCSMQKLIPILTVENQEELDKILGALCKNSIYTAEITFRTAFAPKAIELACTNYPNMTIGAGTIIDLDQCKIAVQNGAKYIVSPGLNCEVAKYCKERGVDYYPGCVTPTEIMQAVSLGIKVIKFFPSNVYGGVQTLKAFRAPFGDVKFIPTGGVNRNNIEEYLALDNVAAVGGSFFVEESLAKMENRI